MPVKLRLRLCVINFPQFENICAFIANAKQNQFVGAVEIKAYMFDTVTV